MGLRPRCHMPRRRIRRGVRTRLSRIARKASRERVVSIRLLHFAMRTARKWVGPIATPQRFVRPATPVCPRATHTLHRRVRRQDPARSPCVDLGNIFGRLWAATTTTAEPESRWIRPAMSFAGALNVVRDHPSAQLAAQGTLPKRRRHRFYYRKGGKLSGIGRNRLPPPNLVSQLVEMRNLRSEAAGLPHEIPRSSFSRIPCV